MIELIAPQIANGSTHWTGYHPALPFYGYDGFLLIMVCGSMIGLIALGLINIYTGKNTETAIIWIISINIGLLSGNMPGFIIWLITDTVNPDLYIMSYAVSATIVTMITCYWLEREGKKENADQ